MDALDEIRRDLRAEQEDLGAVLVRLTDEEWERDTHAPGWKVRDQVAHLGYVDEFATGVIADSIASRGTAPAANDGGAGDPGGGLDYLERARRLTHPEVLAWWEEASAELVRVSEDLDPRARLPWGGRHMSGVSFLTARLMETWSHGLDVVDVVRPERPPTDRIRHVLFLGMRTRPFSYINRGLTPNDDDVYVDLELPSGAPWRAGDPGSQSRISGPAEQFAMVVCQRRHPADTRLEIVGEAAIEWMSLAQAFAGPPGQGRQPGEFPKG